MSRAAMCGMSLSDYLLDEVERLAERPTLEELKARLGSRSRIDAVESPVDAIREERVRE